MVKMDCILRNNRCEREKNSNFDANQLAEFINKNYSEKSVQLFQIEITKRSEYSMTTTHILGSV